MKQFCAIVLLSILTVEAYSQTRGRQSEWKKYKKDVFVSLGTANFLGDLGGGPKDGRDFSPADLDPSQTRTAFGIGYREKITRYFNVAGKLNYLIVKGDDSETTNPYRNNRNLNFRSNIFELSGRAEFGWQSSRTGNNRYGIKKTYSAAARNLSHNVFAFTGVGVFYFNPQGRTVSGDYVNLRPLHTEGQGLPGGPKQYSNISVAIPFGVYYKLVINKKWSVGVELAWRKTFTDYIDDVGSSYYDNRALEAAYGVQAAQMADPAKGDIPGASLPAADGTPAIRGDKQKDSYMSLEITAGYVFKQKRKSARLRSKF